MTQIGLEMMVVAEPDYRRPLSAHVLALADKSLEGDRNESHRFSVPTSDGTSQHAFESAQSTSCGNHGSLCLGSLRRNASLGTQNDIPTLLEEIVVDAAF